MNTISFSARKNADFLFLIRAGKIETPYISSGVNLSSAKQNIFKST